MRKTKTLIKIIFVIFGVVIALVLAHKLGLKSILSNFRSLGWFAFPIFFIGVMWNICYTLAWNQFLKRLKGHIGIFELFRTKIAGEAVNTVTPASFLGGDPVRIYILKKHYPLTEGTASVVVDRTLHTMSVLVTIFVGAIAAFWKLPFLPLNMRYGLPVILAICGIFMAFVFTHQKRGLFAFFMHILRKLRIKKSFSAKTVKKFNELDEHISSFYIKNPVNFWTALALHLGGRFLGILEIYAVGKVFNDKFTFYASLLLGALSPIVNFIFAFIPGALGVLEGAYSGLLYLLRLPPGLGLSIQIFRRIRSLLWIIIGFVALGIHGGKKYRMDLKRYPDQTYFYNKDLSQRHR